METPYLISSTQILTLFFIMLGPMRLLGPFLQESKSLTKSQIHDIAWRAALISAVALMICGYIGKILLDNWSIPIPILNLTSGLIFFIVAMTLIIKPKAPPPPSAQASEPAPTGLSTALKMVITPYGAAILIGLLALSKEPARDQIILINLVIVMFLNYLAMFFIRQIMGKVGMLIMQLLGVVLGVLQAALALNMIYLSIKMLTS
ncbi:MAG: hypothetical protein JSU04_17360 [Bdellovibrionales bacterium]|nr:hypothetical protein [Bdellovibrionales bacterium]